MVCIVVGVNGFCCYLVECLCCVEECDIIGYYEVDCLEFFDFFVECFLEIVVVYGYVECCLCCFDGISGVC